MTLPSTDININTPKKKLIALGVLLLVFIVGFAFGKFNNKPNITIDQKTQTTTQTQVEDKTKTNVVAQQTTQVQQTTALNVAKVQDTDTTTTTTVDKKPTGEEVTTTTTETKVHSDDTDKSTEATKDTTTGKEAEKVVADDKTNTDTTTKTEFHETITQSQPNWRLAAFAGVNTAGLSSGGNLLIAGPLSYGGEIDRRILGPVWLGVMAEKAGPSFEINGVLSLQF